jgi:hypothetical protein
MIIVAIFSPNLRQLGGHRFLENTSRSTRSRHMSHFCLGDVWLIKWGRQRNGWLEGVGNAESGGTLVLINYRKKFPLSAPR